MVSFHRMVDKGLFREFCFFLVFFQILLDDPFWRFILIYKMHYFIYGVCYSWFNEGPFIFEKLKSPLLKTFTFYFLKWGMGNCVEKLNRLTTTVRDQKYFDTMIGADNAIDN